MDYYIQTSHVTSSLFGEMRIAFLHVHELVLKSCKDKGSLQESQEITGIYTHANLISGLGLTPLKSVGFVISYILTLCYCHYLNEDNSFLH